MIKQLETIDTQVLHFEIEGKVSKEDVEEVIKVVEESAREHGKVRALINLQDFHGYTLSGFFADLKFGLTHLDSFSHIAMVGDKKFEEMMASIGQMIMKGEVKYFDASKLDEAIEWVSAKEKV